jgi:hypothetical protein
VVGAAGYGIWVVYCKPCAVGVVVAKESNINVGHGILDGARKVYLIFAILLQIRVIYYKSPWRNS